MQDVMMVTLAAVTQAGEGANTGILTLLLDADIVVQMVLLILMGMSVTCWIIVFNKFTLLQKATNQSTPFLDLFWKSKRLDQVY